MCQYVTERWPRRGLDAHIWRKVGGILHVKCILGLVGVDFGSGIRVEWGAVEMCVCIRGVVACYFEVRMSNV